MIRGGVSIFPCSIMERISAAAQRPAAVRIGAAVHKSIFAKKAFAAESLHVHGNAVSGTDLYQGGDDGFHHADHFVANGDSRHCAGNRAVLDVQIAGADAGEGDLDDGVAIARKDGLVLFAKLKPTFIDVSVGEQVIAPLKIIVFLILG